MQLTPEIITALVGLVAAITALVVAIRGKQQTAVLATKVDEHSAGIETRVATLEKTSVAPPS